MKPSDVVISDPIPLVDTFGRVEKEVAAAYLILAMRNEGDFFQPVLPGTVGTARELFKERAGFHWLSNPYCIPDFDQLIKDGYAERTVPEALRKSPLAFTEKGLGILRDSVWVRR